MESLLPGKSQRAVILLLLFALVNAGAFTSLLGGMMYDFSPVAAQTGKEPSTCRVCAEAWLTYVLTLGIFVLEGALLLFPQLNATHVTSGLIPRRYRPKMLLCATLRVSMAITAQLALSLLNPGVVGALRGTLQLLILTITTRIIHGRKQSPKQWRCLLVIFMASLLIITASSVYQPNFGPLGILVVTMSAGAAAARIILQRTLVHGRDAISAESFVLVESLLGMGLMLLLGPLLLLQEIAGQSSLDVLRTTFEHPAATPIFVAFLLSFYVKDVTKVKLLEDVTELQLKMVSLSFPLVTFLYGLIVFYGGGRLSRPPTGIPWEVPYSVLEVVMYLLILVASYVHSQASPLRAAPEQEADALEREVEMISVNLGDLGIWESRKLCDESRKLHREGTIIVTSFSPSEIRPTDQETEDITEAAHPRAATDGLHPLSMREQDPKEGDQMEVSRSEV